MDMDPRGHDEDVGHAVQSIAPVKYEFAGHMVQTLSLVAPRTREYLPRAQESQLPLTFLYVPVPQVGMQTIAPTIPSVQVAAGHGKHDMSPTLSL
jgi:hypothetical protein